MQDRKTELETRKAELKKIISEYGSKKEEIRTQYCDDNAARNWWFEKIDCETDNATKELHQIENQEAAERTLEAKIKLIVAAMTPTVVHHHHYFYQPAPVKVDEKAIEAQTKTGNNQHIHHYHFHQPAPAKANEPTTVQTNASSANKNNK